MQGSTSGRILIIKGMRRKVATFSARAPADREVRYRYNLLKKLAGTTGLEPATSCVTGMSGT